MSFSRRKCDHAVHPLPPPPAFTTSLCPTSQSLPTLCPPPTPLASPDPHSPEHASEMRWGEAHRLKGRAVAGMGTPY